MIKYLFRKITGRKAKKKNEATTKAAKNLKKYANGFNNLLAQGLNNTVNEFSDIKEKCQDLRQTNFNLGRQHLKNGKLSEAILRFRIIKKIWPDFYDAHYELAYCLALKGKFNKAKKILEDLLKAQPNYKPLAKELLQHLNDIDNDNKQVS